MEYMAPSLHMWLTFAVIGVAILFYAMDHIPLEITSLGVVSVLLVLFHVMPLTSADGQLLLNTKTLLSGFADPALIAVLALLVMGQGIVQTGALETPAQILVKHGVNYPRTLIFLCLVAVSAISAFLNNTPVVVIFIPIIIMLMDKMDKSPSLVLMPLSFVAILGGMTTLIGSSTNLLVAGVYKVQTGREIGFFEFTVPGLFLAGVGMIYVLFIAPKLLPQKHQNTEQSIRPSGKQFIVQIDLVDGNALIGKSAVAGMFPDLSGMTTRLIKRGRKIFLPPFDDITLREGDSLILATTRRVLTEKIAKTPNLMKGALAVSRGFVEDGTPQATDSQEEAKGLHLAEVIVAPASRLDGRTLEQVGFYLQGGCNIVGIQRRSRMVRTSIEDIRLEAGDVLLIVGNRDQIRRLRNNRDVLLMEWSTSEVPVRTDSWKALGIFTAVVTSASSGILPIAVAATLGAFAMILTGCLNIRQASRAVDRRIFMLIGAALAMGAALEATGGAAYLTHRMLDLFAGASILVILSALFLLVAIFTNVLSNNATAVLFTPIAINLGHRLDLDPMIFVTTVIFAANCSFATPMSYKTNLLVMGPGNYKFSDFMKVGIPLILLLWVAFTVMVPWYYQLP
ncbi:SLC13 family permease [Luteithermobacter gelatinilyticus]|uniref:SLC13 family permease n=1 Tax=Luteithermobacter gelatinilyticus TaxID=2582913 RepID=UPI001106D9CD|nr:SLC13 family permease [Luteithermobacter gelatinilyticus]